MRRPSRRPARAAPPAPAGPSRRRHPVDRSTPRRRGGAPGARCPPPHRRGAATTRAACPASAPSSPTAWLARVASRPDPGGSSSPTAPPTVCATSSPCSRRVRSAWRTRLTAQPSRPVRRLGRPVRDLPAGEAVTDLTGVVAAYVTPAHQHPSAGHAGSGPGRAARGRPGRPGGRRRDDYDSEFPLRRGAGAGAGEPGPGQVAYLGTAAKSVAPSLRLGWLVAPPDRLDAITRAPRPHPRGRGVARCSGRSSRCCATGTSTRSSAARGGSGRGQAPRVAAALSPHARPAGPVAGMYSTWLLPRADALQVGGPRSSRASGQPARRLLPDGGPHRSGGRVRQRHRRRARSGTRQRSRQCSGGRSQRPARCPARCRQGRPPRRRRRRTPQHVPPLDLAAQQVGRPPQECEDPAEHEHQRDDEPRPDRGALDDQPTP